jgi:hypothetical protein
MIKDLKMIGYGDQQHAVRCIISAHVQSCIYTSSALLHYCCQRIGSFTIVAVNVCQTPQATECFRATAAATTR